MSETFKVKITGEIEIEADSHPEAVREAKGELLFEAQQHGTRFSMLEFDAELIEEPKP